MALIWLDGFETYGPAGTTGSALAAEMNRRYRVTSIYTTTPYCSIEAGWGGGLAFQWGRNNIDHYFGLTFPTSLTWVVGFAFKLPAERLSSSQRIFEIDAYDNSSQMSLGITEDNSLYVAIGAASATIIDYTKPLIRNRWYYIELKVYLHNSAGTVDLHVNGDSWISLTGQDTIYTSTGYETTLYFRSATGVTDTTTGSLIDDLYILNSAAGLTDFLGPIKVENIRPTGDSGTIDWTPSAAVNHYTLVDENPSSQTDYVSNATVNTTELYTLGNLSTVTGGIQGVQLGAIAALDGPGSRKLKVILDSNGDRDEGTNFYLADTNPTACLRQIETDPDTTNAWSLSAINALSAGVKVG